MGWLSRLLGMEQRVGSGDPGPGARVPVEEPAVIAQTTRAASKPDRPQVVEDVDLPDGVVDLRHLDCRRLRVVGTGHYTRDGERIRAWTFLLVREPNNEYDENAIEVRLRRGRMIGHVSAVQAKTYAPLLDQVGGTFAVSGVGSTGSTSSRLWIDLPKLPALRSFVASQAD